MFLEFELSIGKDKEYKVDAIRDNAIYNEVAKSSLPGLYHLIF